MKRGAWSLISMSILVLCACNKPNARLNAPPHGEPYETKDMQGTLVYMQDNALLANMTVNDSHFLPHRTRLSGAGEDRLCRLAALMHEYGGTIRFDSELEDHALLDGRIRAIVEFLNELGMQTTSDMVKHDLSGGRGMSGAEVILIKANEGTYKPRRSSGSSSGADMGSGGPPTADRP